MKYLKTWMGKTSGTPMGRDDGYPERKFQLIESVEQLVDTWRDDAEYYRLEPVDVAAVVRAVNDLEGVP